MPQPKTPLRVLFVCTGNSARSQMAQALLNQRGRGAFRAGSAGTHPAAAVHPLALQALAEVGIESSGLRPKTVEAVLGDGWDLVITVCDQARETCPIVPGLPMTAHWGVEDPAAAVGDEAQRLRAFRVARDVVRHRIDLLLALPFAKLERMALEARIRAIGTAGSPALR
jgi:arsenate reductase